MNYRTATRQQLLAERARLTTAYRKAEQRHASSTAANLAGGGASRRTRGSSRTPQREVDQLAEQLARVEAELARRDAQASQQAGAGDEATPVAS